MRFKVMRFANLPWNARWHLDFNLVAGFMRNLMAISLFGDLFAVCTRYMLAVLDRYFVACLFVDWCADRMGHVVTSFPGHLMATLSWHPVTTLPGHLDRHLSAILVWHFVAIFSGHFVAGLSGN